MKLLGNLDCEARWAGVALPEAVQRRIGLYAALFAACAPDDDRHDIWVPAPVDRARLLAHPGWTPPTIHVIDTPRSASTVTSTAAGAPPQLDKHSFGLAWADPAAAAANDRSATLAIARELGVALPGAHVVSSLEELDSRLAELAGRPWVCKARWTSAGRDRARGTGSPGGELRTRIARMLERFGPLVLEPWLDRVADIGVCGEVAADGAVRLLEPHHLRSDPRGGFLGIALAPAVEPAIAAPLREVTEAAARRVAVQTGYRGPFAIDAFVYRDGSAVRLHPLCEINARYSFGWIAHGLARRLGIRRLGFDAPPAGATVLIAPGDDGVAAWCA